jgi:hypothetical protein
MNQREREVLTSIRNEIRETLRASERRRRNLTDNEQLEDIAFQLTRTLNTIEHRIQSLEAH